MELEVGHYRMRVQNSLSEIGETVWNDLVRAQEKPTPFLAYAFLHALHESMCASPQTGWQIQYLSLWLENRLVAAMPLYVKLHSYGEYVFDWAWAHAYHEHGVRYYPKLLCAIPFTPVEGSRLLARDPDARQHLLAGLKAFYEAGNYSSSHILFPCEAELPTLKAAGFIIRQGHQFHWQNKGFRDFQDFLDSLSMKKRKNIRAERQSVQKAGISFTHLSGSEIKEAHWAFFKRCYDQTYAAHRSSPYLNLNFFQRIGATMGEQLLLILAYRDAQPIAASLSFKDETRLYGRYWGCVDYVPCLHFETAYYQAIEFCIAQKLAVFEGGAQGEHKMARGFLPVSTYSAHILKEARFFQAIKAHVEHESGEFEEYKRILTENSAYKRANSDPSLQKKA